MPLVTIATPLESQSLPRPGALTDDWHNEFIARPAEPVGVMILLPGYGSDASEFRADSALSRLLLQARITTLVLTPPSPTLFFDAASVSSLDRAVSRLLQNLKTSPQRTVIGGTSAGGTGAIQLAERCANGVCLTGGKLGGVFAVDAPLDLDRIWRGETLTIRRASPKSNVDESQLLLGEIRKVLGGTPTSAPQNYLKLSPLAAFAAKGGNAGKLAKTPVRAYTEPDVGWWITNRALDYYAMNAVDAAALINELRVLGNADAKLVTTSGKGFRPDGTRHPHSWSIVDKSDLVSWVASVIARAPAVGA